MAQNICREAKLPLKVAGHKGTDRYVDDMPRWYDDISVLLITSVTEVHPLVYYEAAAAGRPAVSTLVGDIGFGRSKAGLFFPVDAPESDFVKALKILQKSSMKLNRLGVLARLQAVTYWSWETIAPNYVKYILGVNNHAV
jgi:glycosyltransferase involved in cell wall biosynthesis